MNDHGLGVNSKRAQFLFREIMRVLSKYNASTEEGFVCVLAALMTICESEVLHPMDQEALKRRVVEAFRPSQRGPAIIRPGLDN